MPIIFNLGVLDPYNPYLRNNNNIPQFGNLMVDVVIYLLHVDHTIENLKQVNNTYITN